MSDPFPEKIVRERLQNDLLQHLDLSKCVGRNNIGAHTDLHKLHPSTLFIKVLLELERTSSFSKATVPPFPRSPGPPSPRLLAPRTNMEMRHMLWMVEF